MGKMISVTQKGNFKKTDRFLHSLIGLHYSRKMRYYAELGVQALKNATPKDSGETANAWSYEIVEEPGRTAIYCTQPGTADSWKEPTTSIRPSGRSLTRWPKRHGRRLSDES